MGKGTNGKVIRKKHKGHADLAKLKNRINNKLNPIFEQLEQERRSRPLDKRRGI